MIQRQFQISYQQLLELEDQLSKFDNKKMPPEVERILKNLINNNRSEMDYARLKGLYHICVFNYQQALKNLNEAIQNDPTDIRAYLYRAQAYLNLNELQKAQQDCNTAMDEDQMIPLCYVIQAIQYLEKAIQLDSQFQNAYLLSGQIYFKHQKYQQAVQYLEKAYQIDQQNQLIVAYLINTYYQLQQPQDVRRLSKQLENLDNTHIFSPPDIQFINQAKQLKDKIQTKTTNETTPRGLKKNTPNQVNINVFNFNQTITQDFQNQQKYQNTKDSNQNQFQSNALKNQVNQQTQVCSPMQRIQENNQLKYYYCSLMYRLNSILIYCNEVALGRKVIIEKQWYENWKKYIPFVEYVEPVFDTLLSLVKIFLNLIKDAKNKEVITRAKNIQQVIVFQTPNINDIPEAIKKAVYKLIDKIQWDDSTKIENEINKQSANIIEILKIEVSIEHLNNEWKQAWKLGVYHSLLVFDYLLKNYQMLSHPDHEKSFEDIIFKSIINYRYG